jgi:L-alanine-DL-glutamate epimerase-like enolase superfamily enzyme
MLAAVLYDRLADLSVEIDGYRTGRLEQTVTSGFTRVTTLVTMAGGGHEGAGEDVTYTTSDHDGFPDALPLTGRHTLAELSALLDGHELFPNPPAQPAYLDYRRWAFESAALDLALRQAGMSLAEAVGREARPVRFVLSTRADVRPWLAFDRNLEFKLDPDDSWDEELIGMLAAANRVRVLDFKAYYHGTVVDAEPDPVRYRTLAELFPETVIEDAAMDDECRTALTQAGALDRLSFDAPIHSLADVDALPVTVRWLNIKPSRFGTVGRLLECIDACEQRGIRMYGGGQFELGPGRLQIENLASVFYPDTPNDVAPVAYHAGVPGDDLPRSPLPAFTGVGFG